MNTTTQTYDTCFQVRPGVIVQLCGVPCDLTTREAERLVRMIRTLAFPEPEPCNCGGGTAAPGFACSACGAVMPELDYEASQRLAARKPSEVVAEAFGYMLTGRTPPDHVREQLAAVLPVAAPPSPPTPSTDE